jgi:FAD/FMN-containing dehydrogenase
VSLERALRAAVGADHVLVDAADRASYDTDWTRRFSGRSRAVVRPGDVEQVADVVRTCAEHRAAVVVQGGNTGLVGGGVPRGDGQVVVSTRRLRRLDPVDRAARTVTAGAGITIAELSVHAAAAGFDYGVDLAARDSATVGGTIATNAGGIRVVANGDTRAQVRGVQAVLADGSVVSRLDPPRKDSTGYDLSGLLVGSEGTLGLVTAATLRLVPRRGPGIVTLVGVATVDEALALLPATGLRAAELMLEDGLRLVIEVAGLPMPLNRTWPVYVLLETDDLPDLPEQVDAAVDQRLWEYRERHTEAVATLGVAHKLDVSLPLSRLAEFLAAAPAAVAPHRLVVWGHLAEGNMHVNVVGPAPDDSSVDEIVLRMVAERGGSVAAEHGIGVAKARWLALTRSPAEIAAMRRVKVALDPDGLLNPGVLLEEATP